MADFAKRLRDLAARTGLDGFAEELRALANEQDQARELMRAQILHEVVERLTQGYGANSAPVSTIKSHFGIDSSHGEQREHSTAPFDATQAHQPKLAPFCIGGLDQCPECGASGDYRLLKVRALAVAKAWQDCSGLPDTSRELDAIAQSIEEMTACIGKEEAKGGNEKEGATP